MSGGAEPKRSKVCAVCGTESETFHLNYGASTCFSCRAFFRRAALSLRAKGTDVSSMKCKGNSHCAIEGAGSRKCRRCRFEQCLRMGMKMDQVMSEDQKKCRFKRLIENQVQENFSHLLFKAESSSSGERRKRGRKAKAKFEDLPPEVLNQVKITFKRKKKRQASGGGADQQDKKSSVSSSRSPTPASPPAPERRVKQEHDDDFAYCYSPHHHQQQIQQQPLSLIAEHGPLRASPEFVVSGFGGDDLHEDQQVLDLTCKKEELSKETDSESGSSQGACVSSFATATAGLGRFKKSSLFHLNHIERTWRLSAEAVMPSSIADAASHERVFVDFASQQPQLTALGLEMRQSAVHAGARRFKQFVATQTKLSHMMGLPLNLVSRLEAAAECYPEWFTGFVAFACLFQGSADCASLLDNVERVRSGLEQPGPALAELIELLDEAADVYEEQLLVSRDEHWLLQRFEGLPEAIKELPLRPDFFGDALTLFRDGIALGGVPPFLEVARRAFLMDPEVRRLSPEDGVLFFKRSLPDVLALAIARMAGLVHFDYAGRLIFANKAELFPGVTSRWIAKILRQNLDALVYSSPGSPHHLHYQQHQQQPQTHSPPLHHQQQVSEAATAAATSHHLMAARAYC